MSNTSIKIGWYIGLLIIIFNGGSFSGALTGLLIFGFTSAIAIGRLK